MEIGSCVKCAETFSACGCGSKAAEDNLKALKAIYTPYIGKQVRFITKYGLDKDDMFVDIETIHSIDWDGGEDEYDEPVFLNKEGDRWMTLDYVKENLVENKAAEDNLKALKAIYTPYIGKQVRFITKYGLDKDDMFVDIETIHSIDWDGGEPIPQYTVASYKFDKKGKLTRSYLASDEPVFLNKEGDRWMTLDYVKENLVENKAAEDDIDFDEAKADRNKDGRISDWERAVGNKVAKGIRESKRAEVGPHVPTRIAATTTPRGVVKTYTSIPAGDGHVIGQFTPDMDYAPSGMYGAESLTSSIEKGFGAVLGIMSGLIVGGFAMGAVSSLSKDDENRE